MPNNSVLPLGMMVQNQPSKAIVLAVTSGKGGVGKSNIALNLAICLASAGKRIVLIDADLSTGNLDILMNIKSKYNISHIISGVRTIKEITHVGLNGMEVICGVSGLESIANLNQFQHQRLINEFEQLESDCDTIIIDTGAGIDKKVVGFCLACDNAIVVTTPEPTAMTDAYSMIKVLVNNDFLGRISLVVNMAYSMEEGKKVHKQIATVARHFLNTDIYEAGTVLQDEKLRSAVRRRRPVVIEYPRSAASSAFIAMASRLSRTNVTPDNKKGFMAKVVNWFF
ncbi:MAG: MinD/ParA family protein [Planctomycetota bacterium]